MRIEIKHNFPEVARKLDQLATDVRLSATASALNKTVALAKTEMKRDITAEFKLSSAEVGAALTIRRAVAKQGEIGMEATLESPTKRGRSLNLIHFVERAVTMAASRKRQAAGTLNQLYVQIKRTGGKKPIAGAFIGNKGRTVFERVGKARLPIKPVQTIGIAQMFNTKRINTKVVDLMREKFPSLFDHEVKFFTDKFNSK